MARYIEETEIYKLVEPHGTARAHCSQIDELPRADVVPRAEVTKLVGQYYDKCDECRTKYARAIANEIFEEIEREIVAALRSNYSSKQERVEKQIPDDFVSYMCEGKIAALRGIDNFIAELKKKYTEGNNGQK